MVLHIAYPIKEKNLSSEQSDFIELIFNTIVTFSFENLQLKAVITCNTITLLRRKSTEINHLTYMTVGFK